VTAVREGRDRVGGNGRDVAMFVKGRRKESRKPAENRNVKKGRLVACGTKVKVAGNCNVKMVTE
jgi:hypothetical protein